MLYLDFLFINMGDKTYRDYMVCKAVVDNKAVPESDFYLKR